MDIDATPLKEFKTPGAPVKPRVVRDLPPADADVRRALWPEEDDEVQQIIGLNNDDESDESDDEADESPVQRRPRSPVPEEFDDQDLPMFVPRARLGDYGNVIVAVAKRTKV